ncbi:MAG TPA: hypothetical protein VFS95_05275 [Telluria sp.]|nr:hypothetical protein [Telluria sp.]
MNTHPEPDIPTSANAPASAARRLDVEREHMLSILDRLGQVDLNKDYTPDEINEWARLDAAALAAIQDPRRKQFAALLIAAPFEHVYEYGHALLAISPSLEEYVKRTFLENEAGACNVTRRPLQRREMNFFRDECARHTRGEASMPDDAAEHPYPAVAPLSGKVVHSGMAPFLHRHGGPLCFVATIEGETGRLISVWGSDLAHQFRSESVQAGDYVELRHLGQSSVPVMRPVLGATGRFAGTTCVTEHIERWHVVNTSRNQDRNEPRVPPRQTGKESHGYSPGEGRTPCATAAGNQLGTEIPVPHRPAGRRPQRRR